VRHRFQLRLASRYACFFIPFCIFISNWIVTRTLCEGNLITFTQCSCTREFISRVLLDFFAQPGHWLWARDQAGLAESSPHGLSWAQPKK
jgi:hypothetical protein